jgi:hydrogenase maturation protein HypF
VSLKRPSRPLLAVGGQLKNTVALCVSRDVYLSQHIGDLETQLSYDAFQRVIVAFEELYEVKPAGIACDLHPDYVSTGHAHRSGLELTGVQHHHAHVVACMAENQVEGPVLGVAWDGSGFGPDGVIWGGEFLLATEARFTRAATFRAFRLPGGFKAIRQPCRCALGVLYELMGERLVELRDLPALAALPEASRGVLLTMLARGVQSPQTTSVGRLFDAVASLAGVAQISRFEGQAAMALEWALEGMTDAPPYPLHLTDGPGEPAIVVDWAPLIEAVLADVARGTPAGVISASFHNGLAETVVAVAKRVGQPRVVLSGGCFQNAYLIERTVKRLAEDGFRPYWHQRIPTNDGGVALGQAVVAAHRGSGETV